MMNSVSSSDLTISTPLLENDETDADILHIYILLSVFTVSIIGSIVYIFVFT